MIREDAEKIIRRLHSAALEGSPPTALARETVELWMDALGHLDTGDVEVAVRQHLSGATRWPSPAAILTLVNGDQPHRTSSEAHDGGCPDCRWTGWRKLRWVKRHPTSGKLVEGSLAAVCGCELGRSLHSAHLTPILRGPGSRGPLETKTADDHADALRRLPLVDLDGDRAGLIAWRCSDRVTSLDMGTEIESALRRQAGLLEPRRIAAVPLLDAGPAPSRKDRPERHWTERPDHDVYETDGAGGFA